MAVPKGGKLQWGGKGSVVLLSMQGRRSSGHLQAWGDGGLQRGRKMSSLAQLHFRDQGTFMSSGAKDHQKAGGNQEGTRNTRLLLSSGSTFIEGRHREVHHPGTHFCHGV